jgi:glycosyltransferase involved in cell wall biosynthesis
MSFVKQRPLQIGYFYSYRAQRKINKWIATHPPDYLYCQLVRVTEYVKGFHTIPKTIDFMDVLSKGMERTGKKAGFPMRWIYQYEAKRLKEYERLIYDYFEQRTIISHQDQQLIHRPDKSSIRIIPNGISEDFFHYPTQPDHDLVFVGNLSYAPNIEAVRFIAKNILKSNKALTCLVSGANPSVTVRKLCETNHNITLQGWIEDIRESYARGKLFLAPMMTGTGMQNKLLEAMAMGIPCITTALANNAIQAIHGESILVAEDEQSFLDCIALLLNDDALYEEIAKAGRNFVQAKYSWKESNALLLNTLLNKPE